MTPSSDTPRPTGFAGAAPLRGTDRDSDTAFAEERRRLRAAHTPERKRGGIGWKFGLAVDLALLSLPIPAVIVVPPLLECRHKAVHVGFFAGDSFEACARRRIAARWTHLDARIKMIVRNSGEACARRRIAARWTHLDARIKMIVRNSGQ